MMLNKIERFIYYMRRGGIEFAVNKMLNRSEKSSYKKLYRYFARLSPEKYNSELKKYIRLFVKDGKNYDIDNPKTFNEKIQWLKIHDTTPMKVMLADKYAVRRWVRKTVGEEYLVPLLGVWKKGEDIDFSALPEQFALKANHGSAMNIIVKDKSKLNIPETVRTANEWMHTLFGYRSMEVQYFKIPRRIIAEKYIEQSDGNLVDYKFHCFGGKPYVLQLIGDRDLISHTGKEIFLDMNWQRRDVGNHSYQQYSDIPPKPEQYEKMLEIAEKLSAGFKYVRVDLYVVDGKIYFGEMTFTPAKGFEKWNDAFELELGALIDTN